MDVVPELTKDLEQLSWDKDQGIDKTDSLAIASIRCLWLYGLPNICP
jgi:hypothetical protein